ncbi:hypothetical protein ACFE04_012548 [Oxalis oulophora]
MSSGPGRRVSRQDIQLVQNLIERCLQLYMNRKEVMDTLLAQAKIEPGFTELVWKKLEEENTEFFKAYYLRLMVKNQIVEFNKLLERQVSLMHQLQQTESSSVSTSNGSHIPQLHQNSARYNTVEHTGSTLNPTENMHHPGSCSTYTNGGPSMQTSMHTPINMSTHTHRIDTHPTMLSAQNSNMGMIQGMNGGGLIKSEATFSGTPPFMFGTNNNMLETRQSIGDAAATSFNGVESNSHNLSDTLLDTDANPYGILSQIPRNFSLSDLTADFSQSSDILENYPRSPYLATDSDNFLDSRDREYQGDNTRSDFGSE